MTLNKTISKTLLDYTSRIDKLDSKSIDILSGIEFTGDTDYYYFFKVLNKSKVLDTYKATDKDEITAIINKLNRLYPNKQIQYDYTNLDYNQMQYIWHTTGLVNCSWLMFFNHYFINLNGGINEND